MKFISPIPEKLVEEFKTYVNTANKNSPIGTGWYTHIENAVGEFMKTNKITGDVTDAVTQYFLMDKK